MNRRRESGPELMLLTGSKLPWWLCLVLGATDAGAQRLMATRDQLTPGDLRAGSQLEVERAFIELPS